MEPLNNSIGGLDPATSRRVTVQRGTGPCDFAQGDGAAGDWTLRLRAG